MKAIQRYSKDINGYEFISAGYCGLNDDDARSAIKQLRRWAKQDDSGAKYKIIPVHLVPQ